MGTRSGAAVCVSSFVGYVTAQVMIAVRVAYVCELGTYLSGILRGSEVFKRKPE